MESYALTDIGMARSMNQDFVFATSEKIGPLENLFLVADGMGGHLSLIHIWMLTIVASSPKEEVLIQAARGMREAAERAGTENMEEDVGQESGARTPAEIIGPVDAPVYKVNDIYRKILYIKHENYDILLKIREQIEKLELPVLLGFDMQ